MWGRLGTDWKTYGTFKDIELTRTIMETQCLLIRGCFERPEIASIISGGIIGKGLASIGNISKQFKLKRYNESTRLIDMRRLGEGLKYIGTIKNNDNY